MEIIEKDINEIHKALRCCRDGNACSKCPYRSISDCIDILELLTTELYIAEHPEIFNGKNIKNKNTP